MYYNGISFNLVLLADAGGVPGRVSKNNDGSYTIFIDSRLNTEKITEVFDHELNRIVNGDFE